MTIDRHSLTGTDPLWFKEAIIYQLHVKAYADSDADGIGDFRGLTGKLDYLKDLGITAIWLLPFCPSPLKDDGYDIADYKRIHPAYGTLGDFKRFLKEAHRRGLRVITELVLNHTSDQHAWFQRARRAKPGSRLRNWYVWSDTPARYPEARIIFKDFESSNWSWDPVAQAYYWHRFYAHQPDLNYDNSQVQKAVMGVLDFWFGLGVDGLRMDAVPYLFERDGTNCENLPETHQFLKKIRAHVDQKYPGRMLLAEANQWPEDAVAYFGEGDEFHMAFHFPLMPRLYMALRMEDRFPILDIMDQTPSIPEKAQWVIFLRNHDELTLEMVTDEERDYMYRVYAQDPRMRINLGIRRRLYPLLDNHRRRIELMNALLFSMPGTPVIYYGDEIGMGDNVHLGDRDGVRTPMQWSADRNAGFSRANPQALYLPVIISPEYHCDVINVEVQQSSPHSVWWWMKRITALRKRFKAFSRGSIEFLQPANHRILAFLRRYQGERILVVANLSRYVQHVELDLAAHEGTVPIELFGRTEFPRIGSAPYFLSLGPHSFFWFYLAEPGPAPEAAETGTDISSLPELALDGTWEALFQAPHKAKLEAVLADYVRSVRWFGGKGRAIKKLTVQNYVPIARSPSLAGLALLRVDYMSGDPDHYQLPIGRTEAAVASETIFQQQRWAAIARLKVKNGDKMYLLHDALADRTFCLALLNLFNRRKRIKLEDGEIAATTTRAFQGLQPPAGEVLEPCVAGAEQSNTSVIYGDRFILKLIRRVEPGVNPDLEIGRYLTARGFAHTPPVAGALDYKINRSAPMTLAILQGFVRNQGDAWGHTLDRLGHFFEIASAQRSRLDKTVMSPLPLLDRMDLPVPEECEALIGPYLGSVRLIGQRTAQLHVCLASDTDNPAFAPESFSKLYQRSLYQSMRALVGKTFPLLRQTLSKIPQDGQAAARTVVGLEKSVLERFRSVLNLKINALRIRCHGDYHLGQVLYTGKDFQIIDFEGEPTRPFSERKIKRSPLRDVAGMLRSFHYAAHSALQTQEDRGLVNGFGRETLDSCARFWYYWVCPVFLKAYFEAAEDRPFLPATPEERQILLDVFLLEKAVYELAYELNNRPAWAKIPLQGILQLTETAA